MARGVWHAPTGGSAHWYGWDKAEGRYGLSACCGADKLTPVESEHLDLLARARALRGAVVAPPTACPRCLARVGTSPASTGTWFRWSTTHTSRAPEHWYTSSEASRPLCAFVALGLAGRTQLVEVWQQPKRTTTRPCRRCLARLG